MTFVASVFTLLAQQAPPQGGLSWLGRPEIMMVGMVAVFYFLLIRPQQRQRKELAARVAAIQAGDKVVTTSGIHGIVHNVREHTVVVKVAEATMIEFDKMAVAHIHKKDAPAAK